jgi:hypothetical protein
MCLPVNQSPETIQTHDWIQFFDPEIDDEESIVMNPNRKWTIEEDQILLEKFIFWDPDGNRSLTSFQIAFQLQFGIALNSTTNKKSSFCKRWYHIWMEKWCLFEWVNVFPSGFGFYWTVLISKTISPFEMWFTIYLIMKLIHEFQISKSITRN